MSVSYRTILWSILLMTGVLVGGCQEKKTESARTIPAEMLQDEWAAQEVPQASIVRRDYRLREGDELEVIYHVRHQRNQAYRIKLQDRISVRFPFNEDLTQSEQVQSDGTLRLDLIGSVYVFDRTIQDVQKELIERYSKYVKEPALTVSFEQSNVKISELKEAIRTAPRGQSRLVPITPDGTISLPFISNLRAAGKTINELHRDLNKAYLQLGMDELETTLNLRTAAPMKIFVLGEVRRPGALVSDSASSSAFRELTLTQAIAQAGSYLPGRAELSRVMLVRRRHLKRPQAAIVNVHQLLENQTSENDEPVQADSDKYRYDIWLEEGDVVYVPSTKIAKRADYIEYAWVRGIRAVLGTTTSIDYSATDSVDFIKP